MDQPIVRVLQFEDEDSDAEIVRRFLTLGVGVGAGKYQLERVDTAEAGVKLLGEKTFDVVLLDLRLADTDETETFGRVRVARPQVPIIVVTGASNEEIGPKMVRQGAQDFLVKGKFDATLLYRSITYSIQRQGLLNELENARAIADRDKEARILERIARYQG